EILADPADAAAARELDASVVNQLQAETGAERGAQIDIAKAIVGEDRVGVGEEPACQEAIVLAGGRPVARALVVAILGARSGRCECESIRSVPGGGVGGPTTVP